VSRARDALSLYLLDRIKMGDTESAVELLLVLADYMDDGAVMPPSLRRHIATAARAVASVKESNSENRPIEHDRATVFAKELGIRRKAGAPKSAISDYSVKMLIAAQSENYNEASVRRTIKQKFDVCGNTAQARIDMFKPLIDAGRAIFGDKNGG